MLRLFTRLQSFVSRPLNRAGFGVSMGVFSSLFFATRAFAQSAPPPEVSTVPSPGIVDSVMGFIASILVRLTSVVNDVMIAILDMVITIMQYNRFTSSPVVSAGWSIVRDAVNMFFVVALIAIAVGTIVGYSKFRWQQQVPRLLIFALVINFSKTLCGIMIDIGQVVMLTFANALRDVAAGNFIQLFAISTSKLRDTGEILTNFSLFAGTLMGFLASVWVLATVLALAAILLWRIVYLWMLIVISPLTWFIGGMGDLTHSNAYAEWWKEFTCMVVIGPVLTFFLWLTLVVAGAGNIAVSEFGLAASNANSDVSIQTSIDLFGASQLISFSIAMVMMYAGFRAANNFCEGAKGMAGSLAFAKYAGFPKGGLGRRGASRARDIGLVAGGAVVGGAVAGAKGIGGRIAGSDLVQDTALARFTEQGKARFDVAKAAELRTKAAGTEDIKKKSDLLQKAAGLEKGAAAAAFKPAEAIKDLDKDAKLDIMNTLIEKGRKGTLGASEEQQLEALYAQALGDDKLMKGLDSSGNLKDVHERFGKQMKSTFKGDKAVMENLKNLAAKRPDVTGDFSEITDLESLRKVDPKALAAISSDPALKEKFEKQIGDIDSGQFDKDSKESIKLLDYLKSGGMGGRSREAYEKGLGNFYSKMSGEALGKEHPENLAPVVTAEMIQKPGGEKIAQNLLADSKAISTMKEKNRAGYDAVMASFKQNPEAFKEAVKKNPLAIGEISSDEMTGPVAAGVGIALGGEQLNELITKYKKGNAEERARLESTIANARTAMAARGDAEAKRLGDWFDAQISRAEGLAVKREEEQADVAAKVAATRAQEAVAEAATVLPAREQELTRMDAELEKIYGNISRLNGPIYNAKEAYNQELDKPAPNTSRLSVLSSEITRLENEEREANAAYDALAKQRRDLDKIVNDMRVAQSAAEAEERSKRG